MGKTPKKPNKEEPPLPLPVPYSLYPLRDEEPEELMPWGGDYLLTPEDYVALQDTVGFPLKKSKLKIFLIKKCNVPDPSDYSFPEITETLRSYLETIHNEQKKPTRHSEDFRSVKWYGTDHSFTAMQAAIVKELWLAWENDTPDIGKAALLEKVDSDCNRLVDIFKKHKTYKQMIGEGKTKGSYRLIVPS